MPSGALPRFQLPAQSRVTTRVPDFMALMKPRVMLLAVFTALVGLMIAPGRPRSLLWFHCNSDNRRRRWCRRRAQHVVRRRYRCRDGSHRNAANPSRHGLAGRSACFRTCACGQRSCGPCACAQSSKRLRCSLSRSSSTSLYTRAWLKRQHAAEHRHWRCCRRASTRDWLGSRNRRDRA